MKSRNLTKLLFIIYLAAITWIILFKMEFSLRALDYTRSINLVPFCASAIVNNAPDISEIVRNTLIFVPFGIYAGALLGEWSFGKRLLLFAGVSLSYETLQYIFAIGRSDITDLISNCLGGALGLPLYALIRKLCRTQERTAWLANAFALAGTLCAAGLFAALLAANA